MEPKSQYYGAYKAFGWNDNEIISKESLDNKMMEKRKYISPSDMDALKKLQEQYKLLLEYKDDINTFIINNNGVNKWKICELYGTCKVFCDLLTKNANTENYEKTYRRYKKAFDYMNLNESVRLINEIMGVGSLYKRNSITPEVFMAIVLRFVADECLLLKGTTYDIDALLKDANSDSGFAKDSTNKYNDEQRAVGFLGMYGSFASMQLLFNVKAAADAAYQNAYLVLATNKLIQQKCPKPDEMMFQFKRVLAEE